MRRYCRHEREHPEASRGVQTEPGRERRRGVGYSEKGSKPRGKEAKVVGGGRGKIWEVVLMG